MGSLIKKTGKSLNTKSGRSVRTDCKIGEHFKLVTLVALFGEEFECPASDVPDSIRRAFFAAYCRDARQYWRLLSDFVQEFGIREIRDIVSNLKFAPCACCFGVYNALWNALSRKMSKCLYQGCILEEGETTTTVPRSDL